MRVPKLVSSAILSGDAFDHVCDPPLGLATPPACRGVFAAYKLNRWVFRV